uniref:Ribosomal protein S2 n=1 Tax=Balamuthia mandrillaris TaxID=66527 RepID=A0A0K1DCL3_9EUKA|nr:30S ribosomal protein S2 [Balamuthia mandrillaris]AKT93836.1 ribsomal protein S2 [Balamuthia mandrillaris]AKT93873.1 ribsomal protein S2 [Balamuthia mandrillaris]AKT94954.1 ribosomal protein S2 [Balamuthia mandrillaris]AKT94970.1 ribosomal protein S2 [Balamuthia mandrillaris]
MIFFNKGTVLNLTLLQLLMPGSFVGYDISHWDFRVSNFLLGVQNRVYIHNLNYTYSFLRNSLSFAFNVLARKGFCALVNESVIFGPSLKFFFNFHWKKHSLSRISMTFKRLVRGLLTNRKLYKKRRSVFPFIPHIMFIFSPSESAFVVHECFRLHIPSVSLFDTISFMVESNYRFPANEKSKKAIIFFNTISYLFALKAYLVRSRVFRLRVWKRYIFKLRRLKGKSYIARKDVFARTLNRFFNRLAYPRVRRLKKFLAMRALRRRRLRRKKKLLARRAFGTVSLKI